MTPAPVKISSLQAAGVASRLRFFAGWSSAPAPMPGSVENAQPHLLSD